MPKFPPPPPPPPTPSPLLNLSYYFPSIEYIFNHSIPNIFIIIHLQIHLHLILVTSGGWRWLRKIAIRNEVKRRRQKEKAFDNSTICLIIDSSKMLDSNVNVIFFFLFNNVSPLAVSTWKWFKFYSSRIWTCTVSK